MKKNVFTCVDLKYEGNTMINEGDKRQGSLMCMEQDEKFKFVEKSLRYVQHPELQWQVLDKSKNGKVAANANHVKLELYIPHGDYNDGRELADILMSQVERLGETLCELDMAKVVGAIRKLKAVKSE